MLALDRSQNAHSQASKCKHCSQVSLDSGRRSGHKRGKNSFLVRTNLEHGLKGIG